MAHTKASRSKLPSANWRDLRTYVTERYAPQIEAIGKSIVNRYVLGLMMNVRGDNVRDAFMPLVNECARRIEMGSRGSIFFDEFARSYVATDLAVAFKEAVEKGKLDRFLTPGTIEQIRGAHARQEKFSHELQTRLRRSIADRKSGRISEETFDKRHSAALGGHYKREPTPTYQAWYRLFGKGVP